MWYCKTVDVPVQPKCGTGFLASGRCSPTAVDAGCPLQAIVLSILAVGCLRSAAAVSEWSTLCLHAHGTSFFRPDTPPVD
eukprot:scaffold81772_cov15-Prasinocladus_malaysianus.AAC.1